jgi:hypothetical protein
MIQYALFKFYIICHTDSIPFTWVYLKGNCYIFGVFYTLWAQIYNSVIVPWWNTFAAIANFFGNVFNDPVAAVKVLFFDMAQTVIGYILNMARAIENIINKIPGVTVDITGGLDRFQSRLSAARQQVIDESGWIEYVGRLDFMDYGEAFNRGYAVGEGLESALGGFFSFNPDNDSGGLGGFGIPDYASQLNDIANNTGSAAASLKNMSGDLVYMRDIAEREAINVITTQVIVPQFQVSIAEVKETADMEEILERIEDWFEEEFDYGTEGVYA